MHLIIKWIHILAGCWEIAWEGGAQGKVDGGEMKIFRRDANSPGNTFLEEVKNKRLTT